MSHIAMLLPREELVRQAKELLKQNDHGVHEVLFIHTAETVEQATAAVDRGASILIARGLQALRISKNMNVPVVPVRITTQGLGLLLMKAKRLCPSLCPRVALVAHSNMLCDVSCCNILFNVDLHVFPYDTEESYIDANRKALAWEPEVIIGGDQTLEAAAIVGVPALFLDFIEDSLQEAIASAETALYANEQNKRVNAQFDALLNSTTNGYVQLDEHGVAVKYNEIMLDILGLTPGDLLGRPIEQLISGIDRRTVEKVLEGGNSYSTFLHIHYQAIVAILAPIRFEDGQVEGAVLSCHKIHRTIQMDPTSELGDMTHNNIAERTFENIHQRSTTMAHAVQQAQLFSQSTSPILLVGERGLERNLMAQCIHNNSMNRTGPFVALNCAGLPPDRQMEVLFGTGAKDKDGEIDLGAFGTANNGTLFLLELDKLSEIVQYNIYRALRYHRITQQSLERAVHINVRLIATSEKPLYRTSEHGNFREDLYYMLSGLKIEIPTLRQRPEDLDDILHETFTRICEAFHRYHALTNGAWALLLRYPWPGNTIQINSFMERMILTAQHRTIDEIFVQELLVEMYPEPHQQEILMPNSVHHTPEAQNIIDVLERNNGNRVQTAEELGISTTTLWRRMKKLGIGGHYEGST